MAHVVLYQTWFAPGGRRFRKNSPWGEEIPDNICFDADGKSLLPKLAKVVKGPQPKREPALVETKTLAEVDDSVLAVKEQERILALKTETPPETPAEKFARELREEEAAKDEEGSRKPTDAPAPARRGGNKR